MPLEDNVMVAMGAPEDGSCSWQCSGLLCLIAFPSVEILFPSPSLENVVLIL